MHKTVHLLAPCRLRCRRASASKHPQSLPRPHARNIQRLIELHYSSYHTRAKEEQEQKQTAHLEEREVVLLRKLHSLVVRHCPQVPKSRARAKKKKFLQDAGKHTQAVRTAGEGGKKKEGRSFQPAHPAEGTATKSPPTPPPDQKKAVLSRKKKEMKKRARSRYHEEPSVFV